MRRPRNYDVLNLSNHVTPKELLRIILDYSHEMLDYADAFVPIVRKMLKRKEKKWLYRLTQRLPENVVSCWSKSDSEVFKSIFVHIHAQIHVKVTRISTGEPLGYYHLGFDRGKFYLSDIQENFTHLLLLQNNMLLGDDIKVVIKQDTYKVFNMMRMILPDVITNLVLTFLSFE